MITCLTNFKCLFFVEKMLDNSNGLVCVTSQETCPLYSLFLLSNNYSTPKKEFEDNVILHLLALIICLQMWDDFLRKQLSTLHCVICGDTLQAVWSRSSKAKRN
jgi:hypothetical protein